MRNEHGGGGGRDGGVVSFERWLEDRQAAIKKVSRRNKQLLRSWRDMHEETGVDAGVSCLKRLCQRSIVCIGAMLMSDVVLTARAQKFVVEQRSLALIKLLLPEYRPFATPTPVAKTRPRSTFVQQCVLGLPAWRVAFDRRASWRPDASVPRRFPRPIRTGER